MAVMVIMVMGHTMKIIGIKNMTKELETYLQWRFRVNNHAKYQRYLNDWLYNVTETQLQYFEQEMRRLITSGIYKI